MTASQDEGQDKQQDMLRFFCRHLVGMSVSFERPDGSRGMEALSGFMLSIRGRWLFVTAGHVLLQLYRDLPKCKNVRIDLHDAWQVDSVQTSIPFPLLDSAHSEIDEDGLDVGIVAVGELHRRMLERNSIKAFDELAWRTPPPEMDAYRVLGFPDELTRRADEQRGELGVIPAFLHVTKVPPPPEMAQPVPCFYGRLADRIADPVSGKSLSGIVGLSGGPIFGFKRDPATGQVRYWIIAVQSTWRPGLRVIRGPLMSEIATALDALLFGANG